MTPRRVDFVDVDVEVGVPDRGTGTDGETDLWGPRTVHRVVEVGHPRSGAGGGGVDVPRLRCLHYVRFLWNEQRRLLLHRLGREIWEVPAGLEVLREPGRVHTLQVRVPVVPEPQFPPVQVDPSFRSTHQSRVLLALHHTHPPGA